MKRREVKVSLFVQELKRFTEDAFVTAVFAPTIMVAIDISEVAPSHRKILPLDARMQHIENMVEYLVVRERRSLPSGTYREVWLDVAVELFARDLCRQGVVYFRCPLRFLHPDLLFCFHKKRLQ